jgi:hypothetical protein
MRHPAADTPLPPLQTPKVGRARALPILARLHWPRIIALSVTLSLWPALIFATSRLL